MPSARMTMTVCVPSNNPIPVQIATILHQPEICLRSPSIIKIVFYEPTSRSTMQGIDVSLQRKDSPNLPHFRHTGAHETEALARSDPRGTHLHSGFRTVQRRTKFECPVHQRRPAAIAGKLS